MPSFSFFGGVDFSGAREPLSNLWSAVGRAQGDRLEIVDLRPHAFREDLGGFVAEGWREFVPGEGPILWGVDFPFGVPLEFCQRIGESADWRRAIRWVADRPPDEVRNEAADLQKTGRATDFGGAMAPLDLRLYKQTVEGLSWLYELVEEKGVSILPQKPGKSDTALIEVYPSDAARELGLPRRRSPGKPGERKARAAGLRTYVDFANPGIEALAVTLEDAWDATIACICAFLCRNDLEQPARARPGDADRIGMEGWIYRVPETVE